jgi:Ca2+-binding RTX toxin-like protein
MYGRIKRVGPALLIGLGIAAFPGSALAGEAHVDGDTVVYDAYAGENNAVQVGEVDSAFRVDFEIHDTNPDAGPGCSRLNFQTVTCGVSTIGQTPHVEINLGNLNDSAKTAFLHPLVNYGMTVNGQLGNDTLTGGPEGDSLDGGDGGDTINGGAGLDTIEGGPGGDTLHGGIDKDTVSGNAGQDKVYGDAGVDHLFGNTEADEMFADDGEDETVDCGSGWFANDVAHINDGDTAIDCETTS